MMGFFYHIHAVALVEDLNFNEEHKFTDPNEFYSEADKLYSLVSMNSAYCHNYVLMCLPTGAHSI